MSIACNVSAQKIVDLWPEGKMPGDRTSKEEGVMPSKGDGVTRITNVSKPDLQLFTLDSGAPKAAVIVCPGGGYSILAYNKEGTEIAGWLNKNGIAAVVLKYRVPGNRYGAFMDAQRAIRTVRANAKKWNIDPNRIGIMGFSAGGHLSARAATSFEKKPYKKIDKIDEESCRPDFAVLVYPAYLNQKKDPAKLAREFNLKQNVPPILIIHSKDDKRFVPGSIVLHNALDAAKHSNEFKLYETGGHGYGLRCQKEAAAWPNVMLEWLKKNKLK